MGAIEKMIQAKYESKAAPADFDLEARWRGELGAQERQDIKSWSKMASGLGRCELKIGKQRSRMTVRFDREKLQERSRSHMGVVEAMLIRQSQDGEERSLKEAADAMASLRSAPANSAQGILVKDYGEVLARDWAIQSSAALQALLPARCGLKVAIAPSLASAQASPPQAL